MALRLQHSGLPTPRGDDRPCHFWRLPTEVLEIIFDLAFTRDANVSERTYTQYPEMSLTRPLGVTPMPLKTRTSEPCQQVPRQLAISREWYTTALCSWLRSGRVVVKPETMSLLHQSPPRLRNKITSLMLYVGEVKPADVNRHRHALPDGDYPTLRRAVVRRYVQNVLELCPNLKRLDLADMQASYFIPLERVTLKSHVQSIIPHTPIFLDNALADTLLAHGPKLEYFHVHLDGLWESRGCNEHRFSIFASQYIRVRLLCRGVQHLEDYREVAKAIGLDEHNPKEFFCPAEFCAYHEWTMVLFVCRHLYGPQQLQIPAGEDLFRRAYNDFVRVNV